MRALRAIIDAAQAEDRLAPVTVVVPSNQAGLAARRLLASTALGEHGRRGLVNVWFATPYQLAARLGAELMAESGTAPLSNPVLGAAVRSVLAADTGFFHRVKGHVSTELAVARLYGELSRADPATIELLAASESARTRELVQVYRSVDGALADYHDEDDLARAAIDALRTGSADGAGLGTIVLHLVEDLSPALGELLHALSKETVVEAVVGITGRADADALSPVMRQLVGEAEHGLAVRPAPPSSVLSVADPDEEVRAALRLVLERAERGASFDRMAILYPTVDPYARVLHEQFQAAGVAHNGPASRRLADTMVGRIVVRLFELSGADDRPSDRFRRQAVIDFVAAGPLRDLSGARVTPTVWDKISRLAGVVGGVVDWEHKLGRYLEATDGRIAEATEQERSPGYIAALGRTVDETTRLAAFVDALSTRLDPASIPTTWRERSAWIKDLLATLLPPVNQRTNWPEVERDAADAVDAIFDRLSVLDPVDPGADYSIFHRAVQHELDKPAGRIGRFGEGVLLAPLSAAAGLDVDVMIILGLAEGICPTPHREDSLLPDAERGVAVRGELVLRGDSVARQRRHLLAALAAGHQERIMIAPAGDHRTGRLRTPSRWLLEAVGESTRPGGPPLTTKTWARRFERSTTDAGIDLRDHPLTTFLESFSHGLDVAPTPATLVERDLASLRRDLLASIDPAEHAVIESEPDLRAGLGLLRSRQAREFTRFDGDLRSIDVPSPDERTLSSSRLETWATCPMRYFLGYLLELGEVERPDEIMEMSALDRGSLVHQILEDFLAPVVALDRAERPQPGQEWSSADRDRLLQIAHDRFDEYEQAGKTGKSLLWRMQREQLLADLERWLSEDNANRTRAGAVPEAVEMRFGFDDEPAVTIDVGAERIVRFRGIADRVDLDADGIPIVLDYKTGKAFPARELRLDPVVAGRRLQLGLYAEAVQQRFGTEAAQAAYWYISTAGKFEVRDFDLTDENRRRFREIVGAIVRGIEAGIFPMAPGTYDAFRANHDNCTFCEFDRVCPAGRGVIAENTSADPSVQVHLDLTRHRTGEAEAS
ncbi:MAG: PD-(D/E)XK nuclease family protein [Acidimicrobiales bacterium]|nr:PD-(D/E)XK nuclease family protein [Acidimicrobiales bacterium]